MPKYIFMTGGVVSSLGKGLTFSSIAASLEGKGLKVAMLKLDPYLNVDPGTMNPFEHGEVYVTDDGAETDLDLGHYYRFTHSPLSKYSNATSGQIYDTVIRYERRGDYLGKTVQVIPHVTDEIKARILQCESQVKDVDVVCVEIGGTVGDIESLPFMEAIRQFRLERPKNCLNIHLTYVPYIPAAGEVKTKPTQHSVGDLREIGIIPDIILCRCENKLEESIKEKISLFCSVPKEYVIDVPDAKNTIYEIPLYLVEQHLDTHICSILNLPQHRSMMKEWEKIIAKVKGAEKDITIGIVGKYLSHKDAYKSVFESLTHAAIELDRKIKFQCFESDKIQHYKELEKALASCDGVLVPGGFGARGIEGKIKAVEFARKNKIPFLGICYGLQCSVIELARNAAGLK
ncbi:MAG: CTP synthase, partial [Chlamydiales bacterium]|nr:CTP synthase [Chlamydiales bacterium]